MKLFGSKQESNLKSTRDMVEKVITELKLSPAENRLETGDGSLAWGLMRGSAQVFIFVKPSEGGETFHSIQVAAPIMRIPGAKPVQATLFQYLLELNVQEITGAAFGLKDDTVVILTDRTTQDLDRSEVMDMILRVGYFADLYDDVLVSRFGGRRYSD